jgi:murein DD-endopeptidase MepM/ murein hydrolase activator NlpD
MKGSRILAAQVVNSGKPVHAIWFDLKGDGVGGYYDLAGESLQRPFLMAPVEYRRISSRFSNGRRHPILNVIRAHRGVDYAAPSGTEVMATGEGVIRRRGVDGGYGNLVEVQHANGFITRYGHLSRFQPGTAVGARVAQGQIIGYVGMTGLATGPHLHYEMHQNGRPRDPLTLDLPAGDPIPAAARDRWAAEFRARYAMLVNLSPSFELRMADTGGPATGSGPARN